MRVRVPRAERKPSEPKEPTVQWYEPRRTPHTEDVTELPIYSVQETNDPIDNEECRKMVEQASKKRAVNRPTIIRIPEKIKKTQLARKGMAAWHVQQAITLAKAANQCHCAQLPVWSDCHGVCKYLRWMDRSRRAGRRPCRCGTMHVERQTPVCRVVRPALHGRWPPSSVSMWRT